MSPIPKDEITTTDAPASATGETRLYRLTRGTHGKHEPEGFRIYSAASPETATLRLTETEAAAMGDRVTLVDEGVEPTAGQYTEGVSVTRVEADTDPGDEVLTGPPTSPGTAPAVEAQKEAIKEVQGDTSGVTTTAKVAEGETPTTATTSKTATATEGDGYGLEGMTWSEAKDVVMALETTAEVQAAKKEEQAGKGRTSVLDAADARLKQLKG